MDYLGEFIALGIDAVVLGLCIKQYWKNKSAVTMVQGAPYLDLDKQLVDIVQSHPAHRLGYVAIRGEVRPLGKPISSTNNPGVTGVVQQLSIKEHVVQRSTAGFWSDHERVIQQVHNVMPFVIATDQTSVEVIDPLVANILDLDVISDVFSPTVPSVMDHVWGFFVGIRQRGIQTMESMLRVGSIITGIGELVPTKDGKALRLQPPTNGSPYFLTNMEITGLIRQLTENKRKYRTLCFVFGSIGVLLTGLIVRRYVRQRKVISENEKRRAQLENGRKERRKQARDDEIPELQLCVVCKESPREIILLPCGHFCLCEDCAESIRDNCPVCRADVETKSVAYLT